MSIIIGNNMCITYSETEVKCPICTFEFDAGDKMEKAKYPIFKMKCPACKGAIGISIPIFGGNTKKKCKLCPELLDLTYPYPYCEECYENKVAYNYY